MRLIDADALEDALVNHGFCYCGENEYNDGVADGFLLARDDVKKAPTIDAEPVRRGKWKIKTINTFDLAYGTTGYEPVYQCSVCGGVMESYLRLDEPIMPEDANFPRYCPNCGAKMDKEGTP